MALTDAQWAEQVAAVVADLVAGTITEAQAAALIAAATEDWPTRTLSNADLAARVSRFLARLNGLILTNGPPEVALGELNTFAYDTVNGALYGPKTAAGWGTPVSLVGPPGAQGSPGPKGDQGDQGAVGPKGDTGDVGAQGPKGDTGDTGPQGDTGDTGATGPKGDKGDLGDAFAVNAQGDLAGRAAFDAEAVGFSYLDVDNGNLYFRVAPSGWSGAIPFGKGDKGDQGDVGPEGPQGPAGDDGAPGAPGSDATVVSATVAEIWAAATGTKVVTAERLTEALAPVALTVSGGNLAINGNAGINFSAAFTANTTIPNATNKKPGRTSVVSIGLTGGPWTTSLGSDFKKYAASPAIPNAANAKFDLVLTFTATDVFYSVLVKP